MPTLPSTFPITTPMPASRGLHWCVEGLRLWRRAPFKLFTLCLFTLIVEVVIQRIPWVGSWTLSVILLPLITYGILLGMDELAHGKQLRWFCVLDVFQRRDFARALALAAICGLCTTGIMQLAAWLVYGWPAVDAVWLGHRFAHIAMITTAFERVFQLPGLVPMVVLLLAPPVLLFDGLPPWRAIVVSVRTAWRYAASFGVFLLVVVCLYLLMTSVTRPLPWTWLLMLSIHPWLLACTYAIWHDLRQTAAKPAWAG